MRGVIGRRINPPNHLLNSFQPSSTFSSSSGRGSGFSKPFQFAKPTVPGQTEPESDSDSKPESSSPGLGHGRGRPPAQLSPHLPSYDTFISSVRGAGRGKTVADPTGSTRPSEQPDLPSSIASIVSPGAGRGKPGEKQAPPAVNVRFVEEENRHVRPRTRPVTETPPDRPRMTQEEAMQHARRVLSQDFDEGEINAADPGRGSGGRGRGRGVRGRGRGRGGNFRRREMEEGDDVESYGSGLVLGNNADGEKLAEKLGEENMNKLVEGFEEISSDVLPSPMDDAFIDALHTNYMV